jgi:hypothetical protein
LSEAHGRHPVRRSARAKAIAAWVFVAIVCLGALAVHAHRYYPFIADDALISLRYAERLLDGQGLTWTDGERVEGYSNLLWILCCALLGLFGIDLIDAARIVGFAGMGAAILAGLHRHRPASSGVTDPRLLLPALAAGLGMALTGSFAVWSVGGLEQALLAGLLAWAVILTLPLLEADTDSASAACVLAPGALYGLLCWTRPDGPLFAACACAGVLALGRFRRPALRKALLLGLIPLVMTLVQESFRLLYYGDWLPNTAYSKVALTPERLRGGLRYLRQGLWPLTPLIVPGLLAVPAAFLWKVHRRQVCLIALLALGWTGYVLIIGGDIFPGRRHLVPVVLLVALLSGELWHHVAVRCRGMRLLGVAALLALSLATLGSMQWKGDKEHLRALLERFEWDGQVVGRLLQRAFGEQRPLLAVSAAGTLPYFSGLPSLDMLGLNDRYLAHHPPPSLGRGRIGHELGDGRYVLSREPDLVIFCSSGGRDRGCSRSGRQMRRMAEFADRYRLIRFVGKDPYHFESQIWVRIESPKIGIRRQLGRVAIPGYLFGDEAGVRAELDEQDRIGMTATSAAPAVLRGIALARGEWTFAVESSHPVQVRVRATDEPGPARAVAEQRGIFEISHGTPISSDFELRPLGERAHIRRLTLERLR